MGNFLHKLLSGLKKVAKLAVASEPLIELGLGVVDPPAAALLHSVWGTLVNAIANTEQAIQTPKSGPAKKAAVMQAVIADIDSAMEIAGDAMSAAGLTLSYDPALLSTANDLQVQAINKMVEFKGSIKLVKTDSTQGAKT